MIVKKFMIQEVDPLSVSDLSHNKIKKISERVMATKAKLDMYDSGWRAAKRMVHPYEYVYLSPCRYKNICNHLPISRSYFKMKEMYQEFFTTFTFQNAFCLAEAPGGFVESLLQYDIPIIYGTSLLSSEREIPDWSSKVLRSPKFKEVRGIHKNGDLLTFMNVVSIIRDMKRGSIDLITGDGGFDTSDDYNKQEVRSLPLIYSEIYIALHLQKLGGCFICKLFDTFDKRTLSLIYLLSKSYDRIYLYKPSMSRVSNSEKYVICEKFKGVPIKTLNLLTHNFKTNDYECLLPDSFLESIMIAIDSFATLQILSIERGISIIKEKKISHKPSHLQIINGKKWCQDYNIPINGDCAFL